MAALGFLLLSAALAGRTDVLVVRGRTGNRFGNVERGSGFEVTLSVAPPLDAHDLLDQARRECWLLRAVRTPRPCSFLPKKR